jgi:hypothetical protein
MKTISLKTHKNPDKQQLNTKALIKAVVEQPPQGGFTSSDMRSRIKVLDALDRLNEQSTVLELEDAEHEVLKKCVKEMRWGIIDGFIIEFEDSINNA